MNKIFNPLQNWHVLLWIIALKQLCTFRDNKIFKFYIIITINKYYNKYNIPYCDKRKQKDKGFKNTDLHFSNSLIIVISEI